MDNQELAKLKAKLLCNGFQVNESAQQTDTTFIHGTVIHNPKVGVINTIRLHGEQICSLKLNSDEVPKFDVLSNGDLVERESEQTFQILALSRISEEQFEEEKLGDYFSLHSPQTLFCAPVRQCIFMTMKQPCLFCTFEAGKINRLPEGVFEGMLSKCLSDNPGITSIAIGGGTPRLNDMGIEYFSALAAIAKRLGLNVSVELVPPPELEKLDELYASGIDSIVMSIEVWDDAARSHWCRGKGMIEKRHYLDAWNHANAALGPNRVSSVLIMGTESKQSTLDGCLSLVESGVLPTVIPLRRYPTSQFDEWTPVNYEEYLKLQTVLALSLRSHEMSNTTHKGCAACGGCSLEGLLLEHKSNVGAV